ncbi:MAG: hypothetical protein DMG75_02860 [Acidobacteria bacterium]|nr:MAG: hypothetical protein DMG75_02860 [Acidobacteriota bacterium]
MGIAQPPQGERNSNPKEWDRDGPQDAVQLGLSTTQSEKRRVSRRKKVVPNSPAFPEVGGNRRVDHLLYGDEYRSSEKIWQPLHAAFPRE